MLFYLLLLERLGLQPRLMLLPQRLQLDLLPLLLLIELVLLLVLLLLQGLLLLLALLLLEQPSSSLLLLFLVQGQLFWPQLFFLVLV